MVEVAAAVRADVPAAARLVASAFEDDAVVARIVVGTRRRERLTDLYVAELTVALAGDGVVDVARLAAGGPIVGVAVWEPPGASRSVAAALRQTPRFARAFGLRHLRTARRTLAAFAAHRPTHPHWYLTDLAVGEDARGHGVGTALLRHRLAVVDAAGCDAYLEATTPGSRRLYERLGFEVRSQVGVTDDGQPTGMLRPAGTCAA